MAPAKSLIMGNPDFELDLGSARVSRAVADVSCAKNGLEAGRFQQRAGGPRSLRSRELEARGPRFAPLPGSEQEACGVAKLLGEDCVRRWQCLKIGALCRLDATPHRWFPGDSKNYPLLDLLDDCSRVCTGATIYHREDLLSYFDFLAAAFTEHGLHLELYFDCHSLFFPQCPDALTQLGAALLFYGVSLRYALTPQAKGKIERQHHY